MSCAPYPPRWDFFPARTAQDFLLGALPRHFRCLRLAHRDLSSHWRRWRPSAPNASFIITTFLLSRLERRAVCLPAAERLGTVRLPKKPSSRCFLPKSSSL